MKKWTGFLFCLIAIILAAYYVMGIMAKSTLNKNIDSFPKSSVINLHLNQYKQGWFSSQARLGVKIHVPAQNIVDKSGVTKMDSPVDLEVTIPLTINHGPAIITDNGMRFGIAEVTTQPETHYNALINYFNETLVKYSLPSFELKGSDNAPDGNVQFNWNGLSALLRVSSNLDNINGNLKLYGLNGSASNTNFDIGEISHDLQLWRHQDWLWLGQSHFSITSAMIKVPKAQDFKLEGLDFKVNTDVADKKMSIECNLSLQKLLVNNKNYGPGIFKLSIRNLDPDVMAKINQQQANMMKNNGDPNIAMLSAAAELPKLLTKGPVIELYELNMSLPEGKITGNLKIWFPQNEITDTAQAMQKMRGEGRFKAPITVVKSMMQASIKSNLEKKTQVTPAPNPSSLPAPPFAPNLDEEAQKQTDQLIADLSNKGLLNAEGDYYVIEFKLENQKLLINGKPFNSN